MNTTGMTGTSLPQNIYSRSQLNKSYSSTVIGISEETPQRILRPGVYVPTLAFFKKENEELDEATIAQHAVRMVKAGVVGLVTQGTFGEAVHLSHIERCKITRTTRHAIGAAGYVQIPIIVGCGAQSTSEAIELCHAAQSSGADYALVLPPSIYKAHYSKDILRDFFTDIASMSPLPILIYNYPTVTNGVDLDSDLIIELAKHPNIVGCKLSCNNMGKFNRVAAATRPATETGRGSGFMCFGGQAESALQTLTGAGSGVITGLANLAPKTCVRLVELHRLSTQESWDLQGVVARADAVVTSGGIAGLKCTLESFLGYGGYARKPLPRPSQEQIGRLSDQFREIVDLEKSL
ncbi:hypothetical protein NUU61_000143 [Penicillium alfredii]|uniref:Uncharacterized protein n=1 Tax=Penicillium alfredii TaxID=1506179 RepID=A0A9W9G919_9EURO|nr:uncharacterized protein NUU61_000143 [Penicillium alfredii]KAJ5114384.1 hypothetical protein NUU61_000143 [Penicillium alfredii]